ncbi:AraC family transcriptional regulator [Streptomyces phaeolivaceus]|uniref:AraC family transcriptional regulator n=1 Tax=Streptomyces phaeolivaceus TaxID=2653200 RepID=A0A5P8KCT4_9ACTN|nr:helix-turn-helix transcriptional regulator [Streptomyces phaeolivaceus]QFR01144.1 AraC family transcriptional regulator [Streptomyces phaeolivaceus]
MNMVETGQDPVVERGYRNPTRPDLGLEVLTFADLGTRLPGELYTRPNRLDFHRLTLVHRGEGTAMVDFVDHPCGPGTLLHIRPGQVQRLPTAPGGSPAGLDATVVLFTPDFPPRLPSTVRVTDDPFGPASWQLSATDHARFRRALADLAEEYAALPAEDPELTRELLRQLLAGVLLRIARLSAPTPGKGSGGDRPPAAAQEPYRLFQHELERSFTVLRQAHDYAARLGYSLKTLNRACQRATGHTAKHLIDARVTLEAKRLLAHTDLPVAAITHRLGFTEPTNFAKFFLRTTGRTPGAFRGAQS